MNISKFIKQIRLTKFENVSKKSFIADYNKNAIPYFRLSAIMTAIVSLPFAWLDLELIPSNLKFAWIIRFGIWIPMLTFAYFLSYKSIFIKYFQAIVSTIILIMGLGITAMIFVSNKSDMAYTMYYSGIALIMIGVIIFRLRFTATTIILIILSFSYLLTAIFKQNLLTLNEPINYKVVFFNNTVFLLSFTIILIFASYILENYARKLFSQQQNIKEKNEELTTSEEELRQNNEELKTLNHHVENQKNKIKTAHKNITDSINYAETIQQALLPSIKLINSYLNEYFLLFKPKEKVSGDFYYINKIDKYLVFAIADCTGHGVPGGFLTMLGITYLHEIVKREEIVNPGKILNILRERFKNTFKEFGTNNNNGLDIALCAINTKTNILQYAGAYNPLIIIRNEELIQYKATRSPIGFHPKERNFKNNEIYLQNNDLIYLFSDGFQDQFGGSKNEKFMAKSFKKLLFEIHKFPMTEQKEELEQTFNKWKGNEEQIDDVSVLGIKFKKH